MSNWYGENTFLQKHATLKMFPGEKLVNRESNVT